MTADALDTLPKLLAHNAANFADDIALREKQFGIWRSITWGEYQERTRALALGFRALGIGAGDVIALIGDNRPDWVMGEIAAHAVGARSLGVYRDALDDEVAYLLAHARARLVLAEDEEQVDKLLNISDQLPELEHIVYCDPRGMRKHADPRLMPVDRLVRIGLDLGLQEPGHYEELVGMTRGEDIAILCTTSGTTARPKLAMLTAGSLIRHCRSYLKADPKGPEDEYVSVLPLPWIMEQIYALGWSLIARMKVNFVEEPETMMADFREVAPTFVLFAPRVWEALAAEVRAKVMDASAFKRRMYEYGTQKGLQAVERGGRSRAADALVFRALRDRLGFSRLTSAATGGAALGPDTFRFFQAMGVPLRQLYGQTELLGAYTLHRADDVNFDTVGTRLRRDDRAAHPRTRPERGGRDRDAAPQHVPRLPGRGGGRGHARGLAAHGRRRLLRQGRAPGGDRPHQGHRRDERGRALQPAVHREQAQVLALCRRGRGARRRAAVPGRHDLHPLPIVSKWAERNRITFTTYSDLAARQAVLDLIRAEVEKVNATLPPAQQIRDFVLLYKELDADDGELTRTRKVRRGVIGERYGDIIEAIYRGDDAIPVDTTITFQDGTKQRIRTTLKVMAGRRERAMAAE
jgi:long-chain acyl-CoA synthetase